MGRGTARVGRGRRYGRAGCDGRDGDADDGALHALFLGRAHRVASRACRGCLDHGLGLRRDGPRPGGLRRAEAKVFEDADGGRPEGAEQIALERFSNGARVVARRLSGGDLLPPLRARGLDRVGRVDVGLEDGLEAGRGMGDTEESQRRDARKMVVGTLDGLRVESLAVGLLGLAVVVLMIFFSVWWGEGVGGRSAARRRRVLRVAALSSCRPFDGGKRLQKKSRSPADAMKMVLFRCKSRRRCSERPPLGAGRFAVETRAFDVDERGQSAMAKTFAARRGGFAVNARSNTSMASRLGSSMPSRLSRGIRLVWSSRERRVVGPPWPEGGEGSG